MLAFSGIEVPKRYFERKGLFWLESSDYDKYKKADAFLVRSHDLHSHQGVFSSLAIGRAGTGVNNIPVQKCSQAGIPVFNTPGANSNSVKELLFFVMIGVYRKGFSAYDWVKSLSKKEGDISQIIEKQKKNFKGYEIKDKTLGIIGYGQIGKLVAEAALALGMHVFVYDPYCEDIKQKECYFCNSCEDLLSQADIITIHIPQTEETKGFLGLELISKIKKGTVLLNFARQEVINENDLYQALATGKISVYGADFPSRKFFSSNFLAEGRVIFLPHLGASTFEAEENCANMAISQVVDYLENGNIINSVNFPKAAMERTTPYRLTITVLDQPGMINKMTDSMEPLGINIENFIYRRFNGIGYAIMDLANPLPDEAFNALQADQKVLRARNDFV